MLCIEAIALGDGREIFELTFDNKIISFVDK